MREIAGDVFESLFGDLRCRTDIDNERHLVLLADLSDGHRATGIDVADNAVGALINDALGRDPGRIDVALGVYMNELDVMAVVGKNLRGDHGAAMGALAGRRHVAGARQQHADLKGFGLRANYGRCREQGGSSRRSRERFAPRYGSHKPKRHSFLLLPESSFSPHGSSRVRCLRQYPLRRGPFLSRAPKG